MKKILFVFLFFVLCQNLSATTDENFQEDLKYAKSLSNVFYHVSKKITPSIVNIKSTKEIKSQRRSQIFIDPRSKGFFDFFGDDFFDQFNNMQENAEPQIQQGSGTGVIMDKEGHIITNNHVIEDADKIEVKLYSGQTYEAKVIGTDSYSDLAVLKIDAKDVVPAVLGDSDKVKIGEWVIAGGNPFGLDNTITTGIVSARGREISGGNKYEDYIQTDAAINPGNSGGPLVNLNGEVIGINTAIFSKNGGYMGIGFAIPSNMVKNIVDSLIKKGKVVRGWLGIGIQDLDTKLAKSFGYEGTKGALVGFVDKDGPASKYGVKQGDIILKINGKKVKNSNHLKNLVAVNEPSKDVTLTIFRDKKEIDVKVKLGELKAKDGDKIQESDSSKDNNVIFEKLGLTLEELTKENKKNYKFKNENGLIVKSVKPNSVSFMAGLSKGDLIVNVNGKAINTINEFEKIIDKELKNGIRLLIEDSQMEHYIFLEVK